jgi:hypothetical protein
MKKLFPIFLVISLITYLGMGALWRPLIHYSKHDVVGIVEGDWIEMYESIRDDNVGHNPSCSPEWWE